MAKSPRLQELEVRIINVVADPVIQDRAIVTIEFNDGIDKWQKSVTIHETKTRLIPEEVIEMIKSKFVELGLNKTPKYFEDVKKAAENKEIFKIVVDKP